jgi:chromate reductase, NAD(P)H dehydrogenase (quinone)
MRILAISGSLRAVSVNTALLEAARRLAPLDIEIAIYRGLAALPAFNPDDDRDLLPPAAAAFRAEAAACAGLIFACPEYAHGVPGAFKNALDWLVGATEFPGKPVMLINAAPRAFHAQASLREILETMSAQLVAEAFVTVKAPSEIRNVEALLSDAAIVEPLQRGVERFAEVIRAQNASA